MPGGVICVHRSDIPRRSSPALLASLDEGGIDAAVLTLPTSFLAEDKGYRVVGDPNTMDILLSAEHTGNDAQLHQEKPRGGDQVS